MFSKLLIANRGEIAVRIARTCRGLGVRTVAVYSDADRGALHARRADEAVRIGPAPAAESYLSVASIIEAARRTGAEAVHPGYGFLSENPDLAEACAAAGIAFVGPPAAAMRLMGDKAAARHLAAKRGVPVLPGLPSDSAGDEALLDRAREIGFPLMIKAAAGGGGRGMRLVEAPDGLAEALASARREAEGAFGDGRLLLERAVIGGRHIEVQVLADACGNAVHLGERDCSVQRRHQKVIEESPAPGLSSELRERLTGAALEVARAVGYVNAGTVEFLVDRGGGFAFLEMNTRLQVEHGVTELVTGLDLVELQLRVAAGEPLPVKQSDVRFDGHAIECRVYAEDPTRNYLPSSGRIPYLRLPEGAGVRNDAGVETGSNIPSEYDSLLAKLLVHAPTRDEALVRCARALGSYCVEGVRTNLGLLEAVASSPAFVSGSADLETLESMSAAAFEPHLPDETLLAAAGADLLGVAVALPMDPWAASSAWRIHGRRPFEYTYHGGTFSLDVERLVGKTNAWHATTDGRERAFTASRSEDNELTVEAGGLERAWRVERDGSHLVLESAGGWYVLGRPAHSVSEQGAATTAGATGRVRAPMPGAVVRILVAAGERVSARQPLVLLEAMKMEHIIESPVDGVVETVACRVGQKVSAGDLLIEIGSGGGAEDATT